MSYKTILTITATAFFCFCPLSAEANFQSQRWFYDVRQIGQDMHLTLQLIEEDPPAFDAKFKLMRDNEILFENKKFSRENADAVVGPGCIPEFTMNEPLDCDEDGEAECEGWCGTAYRYKITDECVPPGNAVMYNLYADPVENDAGIPNTDEVDFHIIEVEDTGDSCLGSSCSISPVLGSKSDLGATALLLLVGFVAMWRKRPRQRPKYKLKTPSQ